MRGLSTSIVAQSYTVDEHLRILSVTDTRGIFNVIDEEQHCRVGRELNGNATGNYLIAGS